ncbi:MAG: hypothetical protein PWP06_1647 [Candidatus Marinimicrobia bacterium]|nr:hypothetical protein [Candidatus Neomarinimicrobiota bacterium]
MKLLYNFVLHNLSKNFSNFLGECFDKNNL